MLARAGQITPIHKHNAKQEDIICRVGVLAIQVFAQDANGNFSEKEGTVEILHNGEKTSYQSGTILYLKAGERVTLRPGCYHQFWAISEYAIIGEVSTFNDDATDNVFVDKNIKRFDVIEEDEPALYRLVSDR